MKKTIPGTRIKYSKGYISIKNYFENFGWLYLIIVFFFGALLLIFHSTSVFPVVLVIIVVSLFLISPLSFIYTLVGVRISLRGFVFLFIVTQFLFSGVYEFYLKDSCIKYDQYGHTTVELKSQGPKSDNSNIYEFDYVDILLNTFHTGLTQDSSPLFYKIISSEGCNNFRSFYTILNIQIFISWIYLGVLIATLYQKMKHE